MPIPVIAAGAIRLAPLLLKHADKIMLLQRQAQAATQQMDRFGGRVTKAQQRVHELDRALGVAKVAMAGLGIAGAIAGAAVGAFSHAVREAAEHLGELGEAARQSGGTSQQVGFLAGLGIGGSEQIDLANKLAEGLATKPWQIMYGQGAGIGDIQGPHGNVNRLDAVAKLMEHLRGLRDRPDEQLRQARAFGVEGELGRINVGGDVEKAQDALGKLLGAIGNSNAATQANDLTQAWGLLQESWRALIDAFGVGAFEPIKNGLLALGDALRKVAEFFNANPQIARFIGQLFESVMKGIAALMTVGMRFAQAMQTIHNTFADLFNALPNLLESKFPGIGQHLPRMPTLDFNFDAMQQNTNAVNENTQANQEVTRMLREGLFGGGERASRALPSAWQGAFLRNHWTSGALRAGAFGL